MRTTKTEKIVRVIVVTLIALTGFSIIYPVMAQHQSRRYETVLQTHKTISMWKWHGQRPFLYATWFHKGDLPYAESYGAYENGMERRAGFLDRAIQGGGGLAENPVAFHQLQTMSPLPQGLPSPDSIPHGRLLIISQHLPDGWHTLYYDRENLPLHVAKVAQIIGVK